MSDYRQSPLWKTTFYACDDALKAQRNELTTAFEKFRERVALLVGKIHKDMPDLTVHDISHIDALWWTASEIAGENFPLNPAEAFVLGGAFLLHDAAHCIAAYPGGVEELRALPEWLHFATESGVADEELLPGTPTFQLVLFDVLRVMHPKQARKLAKLSWLAPGDETPLYLLPHDELRVAYGDAIGQVAESHWWSPHELEALKHSRITAPTCLHPSPWGVDIFKLAVLLRTADAAHIDAQRAPRFLFALAQPGGSSLAHWQFQCRMNQIKRDPDPARQDLRISSSPFPVEEQEAWWLAYDAARLIDKELRAADRLLLDHQRPRLAVRALSAAHSPENFARAVPADGWQPVDANIKISDVKSLVDRFGGEKLYGNDHIAALRELLQNSIDAVCACRKLGGLRGEEGEIEVAVENAGEGYWLHVTDTGIGMSRYVLTEVLLDFGRSLWRSPDLRGEWSGLLATGFEAIGQFGIGFFSVFMLGELVRVTTRRYDTKEGESDQWLLEFPCGTSKRPILRKPDANERLLRHGTRVSVLISKQKYLDLCPEMSTWPKDSPRMAFAQACAWLAPALDIDLYVREVGMERQRVVKANDWLTLEAIDLLRRIAPGSFTNSDTAKFGLWSYLAPLHREDGSIAGRCAALPTNHFFRSGRLGVGVVKGLRAGEVEGVAGIVFAQAQPDLARKTAIPDFSLADLQKWAEGEKHLLFSQPWPSEDDPFKPLFTMFSSPQVKIDDALSGILAAYGASHSGLIIGRLGNEDVNVEELVAQASCLSELMVQEGEVEHDDDDDVLPRDFRDGFEPNLALLELCKTREPDWLKRIDDGSISRDTWSLEAALEQALNQAWREVEWYEEIRQVGAVDYHPITRKCRVARRKCAS
ncbi:MAG: ATP-binding protein [Thiobacillus sp.]|nr:ATP-binding protein [Thiobacillus sp.]